MLTYADIWQAQLAATRLAGEKEQLEQENRRLAQAQAAAERQAAKEAPQSQQLHKQWATFD
jgi:hypothetical protein